MEIGQTVLFEIESGKEFRATVTRIDITTNEAWVEDERKTPWRGPLDKLRPFKPEPS
ncbi:hypothetical protein IC617_08870 [Neiella sp. HB171785]|uniref:Uncharacterized protein n=1 Tax=Neiella litorisoli TaxID=2771431 RepID=A0A8J6QRV0_9GAMM|nr:hypothetical protein [Neiella litorisoli]MBD1389539.1 hypothetical protein [Neiella litorisoli]